MKYELALVIKPLNSEDIKDKVMPKIEKMIKDFGGKMTLKNSLGKRLLAYPMGVGSFKEGVYSFYHVEAPSSKMAEIRTELSLNGDILRFLFINEDSL